VRREQRTQNRTSGASRKGEEKPSDLASHACATYNGKTVWPPFGTTGTR
jgi:hypothetical protein